MSAVQVSNEALSIANSLFVNGQQELDHLILGEDRAKAMAVAGLVLGENILYVGDPGGGKSTLTENFYRIVSDIDATDVANVPHRSDLTGAQLVGDSVAAVKTMTTADGEEYRETISSDVQPIISQDTKIVRFDEINRLNPYTANAALGILATRKLIVRGQEVPMKGLEMVVSTMNPSESLQGTHRLTHALGSRQGMGVVLGATSDQAEQAMIADRIWGGWTPTPEDMRSVVNLDELHQVRAAVPYVVLSDDMRRAGRDISLRMNSVLRDEHRIAEATGRMVTQLSGVTRALSLLNGRVAANENDLREAVDYTVTARMSAINGSKADEIGATVAQIVR